MAVAIEFPTKEDFFERMEDHLSEKGLEIADLQVNLKVDDIDKFIEFIGKNWYNFGILMDVKPDTMDHIKKGGSNKQERKRKLLEHLVKMKTRYKDIIYGLYSSAQDSAFINDDVLDYIQLQTKFEEPKVRKKSKVSRQNAELDFACQTPQFELPCTLSPEMKKYHDHFYKALLSEESEHKKKLEQKCDGRLKLYVYEVSEVPLYLGNRYNHSRALARYGYIVGPDFTDDKIEYVIQASDNFTIVGIDGSEICKADNHHYNFKHLHHKLFVCFRGKSILQLPKIKESCAESEGAHEVSIKFEVKNFYSDQLLASISKMSEAFLLPNECSFSELQSTYNPVSSSFKFMELDENCQLQALQMITTVNHQSTPFSCPPPPVILYGPFGSGKTRVLARAAYEITINGIKLKKHTRILICAHHYESLETFIFKYFGPIEREQRQLFRVFLISNERVKKNSYKHLYMTKHKFSKDSDRISQLDHVIIITTYTMSLNLHQYFHNGFFTHLLLDEAAQVREPEAVTPLAMATKDAKIVLAGDDKQVGLNILVLQEEARKHDLHISLLERMMMHYHKLGPIADSYVTRLSVNYRMHESLVALPIKLFYPDLKLNDKYSREHKKPVGYRFVCSDSKLVPPYISQDYPLVEACIVLEEVRSYLRKMKELNEKFQPRNICIISSTKKQLNQIKQMAGDYKEYYEDVMRVSFKPSYMIQGHEFEAIFLSLFEPVENDEMGAFFTKSLFNPDVFNAVITRARTHIVGVGKPMEILQFENASLSHFDCELKCECWPWHEYIRLCQEQKNLQLSDETILGDIVSELDQYAERARKTKSAAKHTVTQTPTLHLPMSRASTDPHEKTRRVTKRSMSFPIADEISPKIDPSSVVSDKFEDSHVDLESLESKKKSRSNQLKRDSEFQKLQEKLSNFQKENDLLKDRLKTFEDRDKEQTKNLKKEKERSAGKLKAKDKELNEVHAVMKNLTTELNDEKEKQKKLYTKCAKLKKENIAKTIELKALKKQVTYSSQFIDSLADTVIAAKKIIPVVGNISQYVDWEGYGLRIHISEGTIPASETTEHTCISIAALVGGKFMFPPKTKLVSAVYAISVSTPLAKPVKLEIQHCVHLVKPDQTKYLKFATASHMHGSPYKFHLLDEGEFTLKNWYGSIDRTEFSFLCVESVENDEQPQEEEGPSSDEDDNSQSGGSSDNDHDKNESHDDSIADPSKQEIKLSDQKSSEREQKPSKSNQRHRVARPAADHILYCCQLLYVQSQDRKMPKTYFVVAKQLDVLLKYIKSSFLYVEEDECFSFHFTSDDGCIKLNLEAEQAEPHTGWKVQSHRSPCQLKRTDVDRFGLDERPASCLLSVYPEDNPNTTPVSTLHYGIPLEGIIPSTTIYIHRTLEDFQYDSSQIVSGPLTSTSVELIHIEDTEKVKKNFRSQFGALTKLMSVATNRLNIAPDLYSKELICESSYDEAVDQSPSTDKAKGNSLMTAIKNTIYNNPIMVSALIEVLREEEVFKSVADKLSEGL